MRVVVVPCIYWPFVLLFIHLIACSHSFSILFLLRCLFFPAVEAGGLGLQAVLGLSQLQAPGYRRLRSQNDKSVVLALTFYIFRNINFCFTYCRYLKLLAFLNFLLMLLLCYFVFEMDGVLLSSNMWPSCPEVCLTKHSPYRVMDFVLSRRVYQLQLSALVELVFRSVPGLPFLESPSQVY